MLLLLVGFATLAASAQDWRSTFDVKTAGLVTTGASRYFLLDPGYQLVLEDGDERLVISVLDETKLIDGVTTRVVEERETKGGKLVDQVIGAMPRGPLEERIKRHLV